MQDHWVWPEGLKSGYHKTSSYLNNLIEEDEK